MSKRQKNLLLLVFLFNSFLIFVYTVHHRSSSQPEHHRVSSSRHRHIDNESNWKHPQETRTTSKIFLKPWPILPSYLPWTTLPLSAPSHACEGHFGNGFNQRLDLLLQSSKSSGKGWFRCHYSKTLESSVCEGANIRMDVSKVRVSYGGEELEMVMGRGEDEELPKFEEGAFDVLGEEKNPRKLADDEFLNRHLPRGDLETHPMRNLVGSLRAVNHQDFRCDRWIEEPTLMVIRFEYANLFHTVTDWYSAYVACRVTNLPYRPHLVFMDGHCRTQLEETWRALFSSVRYAKHFNGSVCFRHVVFAPIGYETALFKGLNEEIECDGAPAQILFKNPNYQKTARISEFGEMIRAAFGFHFEKERSEKQQSSGHKVLFVRREDYMAHPRHGGKVESRLSNEEEVFQAVREWTAKHRGCKVRTINGLLAHMSLKVQVRAIQEASVIIGAHGAGLTHIVAATPGTVILEIISSYFRRPHFRLIARWKGLTYHAINLRGSHAAPESVIEELGRIMRNLGC